MNYTKRDLTRTLLLLTCAIVYLAAFSQKPQVKFTHFKTDQGLSESNVLCMLQDSRGFMWFGTGNGLNRFDGYNFTIYKHDPADSTTIGQNFISYIDEGRNGDLWISTLGGGLSRYNRKKNRFTTYMTNPANHNSISRDDIYCAIEDSYGKVWIGTMGGGLDLFDPATKTFRHFVHDKQNSSSIGDDYVRCIFEDSRQNIWIGTTNGGLQLYDRARNSFTRFQFDKKNDQTISSNNISVIFEDSRGNLWIGTAADGLNLYNSTTKTFTRILYDASGKNGLVDNAVRAIGEDSHGNLWFGTENAGINIFNPKKNTYQLIQYDEFESSSLGANSINTIYKDGKGNMWVGTFNAGIGLVSIDAGKFAHYKHHPLTNSLSNDHVLCVFEDSRKRIWIGTDGGGLNLFDPQKRKFTCFKHKPGNANTIAGNNVLSVCEDRYGNLWIGTWAGGVTVFNKDKNTFKHYRHDAANPSSLSSNEVWTVFADDEKNIWIGTYGGGVNRFEPATQSFTRYQYIEGNDTSWLNDNWINALFDDHKGNIWISTAGGGINIMNKKTQHFSYLQPTTPKTPVSSTNVRGVCEDYRGNLWIASTYGVTFIDRKINTSRIFTSADGLSGDGTFGILEDDNGNIWISTDKGISMFDQVKKKFKNYGVSDGLQSNEFKEAFCKTSGGQMYFGGNNGFNLFHPDSIGPVDFDAPVVITRFLVFNKPVAASTANNLSVLNEDITETRSITLPYDKSMFSFEFASLNYTSPEKKKYAYILEGFDKTWNESQNHTATYTNLDPGKYVFKVRGVDNEGRWSDSITSIELIISPPFWLTWWFRISVLVIVAGSAVAFYKFRVNRIKNQKIKLEQLVNEQTSRLLHSTAEEKKARHEAEKARHEEALANKELERKNQELEQFAYITSHDLQEPLRTTSGFAELLQKKYADKLDEKARTYIAFIMSSADRMKVLISDLLDYSRIGRKRDRVQIDCNQVLQELTADLQKVIGETGTVITCGSLPVISGFHTEIKQLFQNLVLNAIKFSRKDVPPRIGITAERKEHMWLFACKDNGIGIEEQYWEKIFVIFQRLHSRAAYEGSGIGLAHCKKIVELHGGTIWVDSTFGEGTVFYFTIPCP